MRAKADLSFILRPGTPPSANQSFAPDMQFQLLVWDVSRFRPLALEPSVAPLMFEEPDFVIVLWQEVDLAT
jgi:hypothetical protein